MSGRNKLVKKHKRVQLGSKAQQKAASYNKPSNVRSGTYNAQRKNAAAQKAYTPTSPAWKSTAGSQKQTAQKNFKQFYNSGGLPQSQNPAPKNNIPNAQRNQQPSLLSKDGNFAKRIGLSAFSATQEARKGTPEFQKQFFENLDLASLSAGEVAPALGAGLAVGSKSLRSLTKIATASADDSIAVAAKAALQKVNIKLTERAESLLLNPQNFMPSAKKLTKLLATKGVPPQAVNPKSFKLTIGAAERFVKKFKYPLIVMGIISSMLTITVGTASSIAFSKTMAENERNDARQGLNIAVSGGDLETLEIVEKQLIEINEGLSWADEHLPIYNYLSAAKTKQEMASFAINLMKKVRTQKNKKERDFHQQTKDNAEAKLQANLASEKRFADAQNERREFNAETEKKSREYWENQNAVKALSAEENRKFWANYQKNKQLFWEEFQKNKKDNAPSKLGFGLL